MTAASFSVNQVVPDDPSRLPFQITQPGEPKQAPLRALKTAGSPSPRPLATPLLPSATPQRSLSLTAASTIEPRPVQWLWQDRLALGTLALLAGREGIGKSTVGYTLVADITRGRLSGIYSGQSRAVVVVATEDSWAHTIVPRLMAAGADLTKVYRVDVSTSDGVATGLSLPRDLPALERVIGAEKVALILLDPLMSRLDGSLDTHKDAEVRLALEPLVALADRTGASILGLIHVNKSTSGDPLTLVMGSRAFTAVSRAVMFVMTDPDDETMRLLGQPKNNLGSTELPTLAFRIESAHVADTDEGPVWTGRLRWTGESDRSIREALESSADAAETRSATSEAAGWLEDYLTTQGGSDASKDIKAAGQREGHSKDSLLRALKRLHGTTESRGFPRATYWTLPSTARQSSQSPGETAVTTTTASTDGTADAVDAVDAAADAPRRHATTSPPLDGGPDPRGPATCARCGRPAPLPSTAGPAVSLCASCAALDGSA
jgi:hypothetical protein